MSVLIKGMNMPKNEDELLSIHIYPSGKVTRQFDDKCSQIAEAVEITSPHGDLIDKDEILYYFEPYKDGSGSILKITSPVIIESES